MSKVPHDVKRLALSRDLKATIRVGKLGITENLIAEITDQLTTKSIVKIKINRGLFQKGDVKNIWTHLAESTNSILVSSRGNVGVLWKH